MSDDLPPSMSTIDLQAWASTVHVNLVSAYFDLASIAILVYDYFVTLHLEIDLTWGTPWKLGRVMFFLTRYTVFIDAVMLGYFHFTKAHVSPRTCFLIYQTSGWFLFGGVGIAEIILIFRTWATWGQNRTILVLLVVLMTLVGVPAIYLTHAGLTSLQFSESPIPTVRSCFIVSKHDKNLLWDFALILLFETIILGLTLLRRVCHYGRSTSSMASTLYKDGITYYIYLTGFSIANVAFLGLIEDSGATLILMQRVIHSVLTGRILLNIRLAGAQDRGDTDATAMFAPNGYHGELSTIIVFPESWFEERRSNMSEDFLA
ncbi:hypothetical protein K439DRAFT_1657616 [Ramaria rubella]|nr:hypothetical protein K439DRAFT_1657616 [Ramaria rubella]